MKIKKILILFLILMCIEGICYATEEVYEEVGKGFRISDFTKEAKKYTENNFPEFDMDLFIKNGYKGETNLGFLKKILAQSFGDEIASRY